jgi:hypothetical protein
MTRRSPDSVVLDPPVEAADALDLDEVRRCTGLLQRIVADRGVLASVPLEMRQALLIAAGQASRPASYQEKRLVKTLRRVRRLGEEAQDRESRAVTGIRQAREATVFVAPALVGDAAAAPPRELKKPRACYVCKTEFTRLHHFYDSMCTECADFNYQKRFQTTSLHGRVGLVTGSRVKIGFQTALKMLRAGPRAFPRIRRSATRGSPTSRNGSTASTSTASIFAILRASRYSRATSSTRFRGSTSSSTTPARPCVVRPASTRISCRRSPGRPPISAPTSTVCSGAMKA